MKKKLVIAAALLLLAGVAVFSYYDYELGRANRELFNPFND